MRLGLVDCFGADGANGNGKVGIITNQVGQQAGKDPALAERTTACDGAKARVEEVTDPECNCIPLVPGKHMNDRTDHNGEKLRRDATKERRRYPIMQPLQGKKRFHDGSLPSRRLRGDFGFEPTWTGTNTTSGKAVRAILVG
jgi:hypothetical protein